MAWAHLTVTQHVLIKKIFGIFAVSCTVHVNVIYFDPLPSTSTSNSTGLGLALGLPRLIDIFRGEENKKKHTHNIPPTQVHGLFHVFQEKKTKQNKIKRQGKYFLFDEVDQIVRVRGVFEFSIGDKHAKMNLCGSCKHSGGVCVALGRRR